MKTTVSRNDFHRWFTTSDTYKNNFSDQGLIALFNYLEEYEEETGEQMEFDPVAIACDFSEYDSLAEAYGEYELDEETESEEKTKEQMLDYFNDRTTVIEFDNGKLIIQDF